MFTFTNFVKILVATSILRLVQCAMHVPRLNNVYYIPQTHITFIGKDEKEPGEKDLFVYAKHALTVLKSNISHKKYQILIVLWLFG